MHDVKEDKKELATNRLLEILRDGDVEEVEKDRSAGERVGLSEEEQIALTTPASEDDTVEPILAKKRSKGKSLDLSFLKKVSFKSLIETIITRAKELIIPNKGVVGIDIGSDSIKYVLVEEEKKKHVLKDMGTRKIEGVIPNDPESRNAGIQAALKDMIPEDMRKKNDFAVSIFGPNVSIKKINLPQLPKKEIVDAIEWNAKKELPFPAENAKIDHVILGPVMEAGVEKTEVLVAAVDQSIISIETERFKSLDIEPIKLLPVPLSIYYNFLRCIGDGEDVSGVIIEIGATVSNIIFVHKGHLQFAREIAIGGDDISEGMIGTISTVDGIVKIDKEEAERLKYVYGIPELESTEVIDKGITLNQISSLMRPSLERLLVQIQRSFDYYRSKFPGLGDIDTAYISGGTALMKNFSGFLADGLGKEVNILNPLQDVVIDKKLEEDKDPLSVASSLTVALGNVFSDIKGVNLVPEEFKLKVFYDIQKRIVGLAAAVILIVLSMLSVMVLMDNSEVSSALADIQGQNLDKTEYNESQRLQSEFNGLEQVIQTDKNRIGNLMGGENLVEYLKLLSSITPDYITIQSINLQSSTGRIKRMSLEGWIEVSRSDNQVYLADFNNKLVTSNFFNKVDPFEIIEDESGGEAVNENRTNFMINCEF
ncbi:MAG: pilus assembly protein PilM [bacterium]|nr:pilus assembly protein PilM [bacterium]